MYFISTRNRNLQKTLSEAIRCGLADDGGLFIPAFIPKPDLSGFGREFSYPEFAARLLHYFFKEDDLDKRLSNMCQNAFTFPLPIHAVNQNTFMLELFHGPTLSFKDFGARFLAECFNELSDKQMTTILVATSGDTGSAVASAFYQKSNVNVVILYPKGQISKRQEHQITCWDKNVLALAVDGTFDDCQTLVKTAFHDGWWQKRLNMCSANSINIGRLLPQISYYAYSSVQFYHQQKTSPGYIVPTGNLGNGVAAYIAQLMGFPIREIVLATNANQVIPNYLHTGKYHPSQAIPTLANAMDVGNPSNLERLLGLFDTFDSMKSHVRAFSVSDDEIRNTIKSVYEQEKIIICPHTATAFFARQQLTEKPWIIVSTADPCKFEGIIDPLIQVKTPLASPLQALLDKPKKLIHIVKTLADIQGILACKKWIKE